MATYTSTVFASQQPRTPAEGGMASQSGQLIFSAATSLGDVGFLCKIPHGAVIHDIVVDHSALVTAIGVDYGLAVGSAGGAASYSALISALATATIGRRVVVGVPITVSCSDLDPNRYGILSAKVASGSMCVSLVINFSVTYRTGN